MTAEHVGSKPVYKSAAHVPQGELLGRRVVRLYGTPDDPKIPTITTIKEEKQSDKKGRLPFRLPSLFSRSEPKSEPKPETGLRGVVLYDRPAAALAFSLSDSPAGEISTDLIPQTDSPEL